MELGLSELSPDAAPASSPVPTALAEALRLEAALLPQGKQSPLGVGLGTKPSEGGGWDKALEGGGWGQSPLRGWAGKAPFCFR